MVNYLRKKFIKNYNDVKNTTVRAKHGRLAAFFGIFSNLLLFIIKIIVGILTLNISVFTDSINNLSDMASSIVILIGFHYSKQPADKEHPFGHERIEYIVGLIISILIILSGAIMVYVSIKSIINYEYEKLKLKITIISLSLLFITILVKLYQSIFNRKIGNIIDSDAIRATSQDSFNDSLATSLVFITLLITLILQENNIKLKFSLDGYLGILISLYLIFSGLKFAKDEINHLIGNSTDYKSKDEIVELVKSYKGVIGVHDVLCHSYGPTKVYMTLHIEMNSNTSIIESHDLADLIEHDILDKYNVLLTIHVDPIDLSDPILSNIKDILDKIITNYTYHDLRIVKRNRIKTIEFDLVVPYDEEFDLAKYKRKLKKKLIENHINYNLYITLDRK